jgi:4,5-dihydroxyphthalate decarboxylase
MPVASLRHPMAHNLSRANRPKAQSDQEGKREASMPRLSLTYASCKYDRIEALRAGEVQVEGIDLNVIVFPSGRQIFDRMVGGQEFDASELSASEYISLTGRGLAKGGDSPFVAIPVFPSRVFRHGYIFVNKRAGIHAPKDLEGRRVGLPLYTQTASIWVRGHLMHQFGVDLNTIRWVQGAVESGGAHGNPHALPLLRPARIEQNRTGRSLGELLASGEIDAYLGSRKPVQFGTDPDVVRLLPNHHALERALFERERIFPIMHLVAIRRALYDRHPWIANSLYAAFVESKRIARVRLRYAGSLAAMLPWLQDEVEEIDEVFGGDAFPYGIEPNRPTLEALVQYMVEQHFIPETIPMEKLFVPLPGASGT